MFAKSAPLDARVAIVTGAGRGLGRAFAIALAEAGAKVVVNSQSSANAAATAELIRSHGHSAIAAPGDVSAAGTFDHLVDVAMTSYGALDILVNNAGISRPAMVWKMTDDEWDDVLRVNLTAPFRGIRAVAPVMIEQRYGRIINITSAAGIEGSPSQANYGAAKAGVIGLTKSAARQLARFGITVNAVSPVASTPMTAVVRASPDVETRTLERIPMARWAEAAEVAPAVVHLASEVAGYTTGSVVLVDGGLSM